MANLVDFDDFVFIALQVLTESGRLLGVPCPASFVVVDETAQRDESREDGTAISDRSAEDVRSGGPSHVSSDDGAVLNDSSLPAEGTTPGSVSEGSPVASPRAQAESREIAADDVAESDLVPSVDDLVPSVGFDDPVAHVWVDVDLEGGRSRLVVTDERIRFGSIDIALDDVTGLTMFRADTGWEDKLVLHLWTARGNLRIELPAGLDPSRGVSRRTEAFESTLAVFNTLVHDRLVERLWAGVVAGERLSIGSVSLDRDGLSRLVRLGRAPFVTWDMVVGAQRRDNGFVVQIVAPNGQITPFVTVPMAEKNTFVLEALIEAGREFARTGGSAEALLDDLSQSGPVQPASSDEPHGEAKTTAEKTSDEFPAPPTIDLRPDEITSAGLDEALAGLDEAVAGLDEAVAGLDEAVAGLDEAVAGLDEAGLDGPVLEVATMDSLTLEADPTDGGVIERGVFDEGTFEDALPAPTLAVGFSLPPRYVDVAEPAESNAVDLAPPEADGANLVRSSAAALHAILNSQQRDNVALAPRRGGPTEPGVVTDLASRRRLTESLETGPPNGDSAASTPESDEELASVRPIHPANPPETRQPVTNPVVSRPVGEVVAGLRTRISDLARAAQLRDDRNREQFTPDGATPFDRPKVARSARGLGALPLRSPRRDEDEPLRIADLPDDEPATTDVQGQTVEVEDWMHDAKQSNPFLAMPFTSLPDTDVLLHAMREARKAAIGIRTLDGGATTASMWGDSDDELPDWVERPARPTLLAPDADAVAPAHAAVASSPSAENGSEPPKTLPMRVRRPAEESPRVESSVAATSIAANDPAIQTGPSAGAALDLSQRLSAMMGSLKQDIAHRDVRNAQDIDSDAFWERAQEERRQRRMPLAET